MRIMGNLTAREIIEATGGRVIYGNSRNAVFTGVSIDSRTIRKGELFIALKGQRFDGHDYLADAMGTGSGALISDPPAEPGKGKTIIYVNSTLKALHNIAHYERMKRDITVIGVTGTNGKTTTKELIFSILSLGHKTLRNSGNLNNHIGLPLSLLKIEDEDEFAVLEMGASIKGDIRQLCDIAAPGYGVITNIGPGHLEGFGNLDVVRSTKLELLDAVKTIVLNADDEFLMEGVSGCMGHGSPEVITFGINNKADVYAADIVLEDRRSIFNLCLGNGQCTRLVINISGRFNVYNALAAASVCNALGIAIEDIKKGMESFMGVPMRLEVKGMLGATVISDVYNANPASMEEAVKELVRIRKRRSIAVLGDMLELGSYSEDAHRKLGMWMSQMPVDVFIAVGPMMSKAAEEFSVSNRKSITVPDAEEARRILSDMCKQGDTILVKGSRAMNMERVLEESPGKNVSSLEGEVRNAL